MPLIFLAALSYAAGLLLGFGGALVPALALAAAGIAVASVLRRFALAALLALIVTGAFVSTLHRRATDQCIAELSRRHAWDVVLDAEAGEGDFVTGDASDGACTARVALSVERGGADAGDRVRVTGRAVSSDRGIVISHVRLFGAEPSDRLRALRAAADERIGLAFGADAPLAKALLVADMRDVDPAVRERFATAGIIHMLSISGLHVGLIAMALSLLFGALRLPKRAALASTVLVTALYVAMLGAPPPALRSAVMLGVVAASRVLQRPTSPWAALAIGGAAPLVLDAATVLDIGWQLSVLGMAGLLASNALTRRWLVPPRFRGLKRAIVSGLLSSVVASTVSAPLVAWSFGRVSLVAPLANLVAAPIMGLLQPVLFLALALSPVMPAARFVAGAAHPLILAFDAVAERAAAVPFASITVAPTALGATLAGCTTIALIAACVSRAPGRALVGGALAIALLAWTPIAVPLGSGEMELHVIDVGQGDALAIRTPRGHWVLVDAGRTWKGGDAGRASVIPYVQRYGGPIDLFALSHPHADHVGGAASVIRALRPAMFWDGAYRLDEPAYRASLVEAQNASVSWHRTSPGDSIAIDSVHLTVLAPDSAFAARQENPNEASVALLVRYGTVRFLLMGDAEQLEESWIVSHDSSMLRAEVLKVGHHGSRTSSGAALLRLVQPKVALVSVGAGNKYGHPSHETMRALAAAGAQIFRTDQLGAIVVRTDGRSLEVSARDERWRMETAETRQ